MPTSSITTLPGIGDPSQATPSVNHMYYEEGHNILSTDICIWVNVMPVTNSKNAFVDSK